MVSVESGISITTLLSGSAKPAARDFMSAIRSTCVDGIASAISSLMIQLMQMRESNDLSPLWSLMHSYTFSLVSKIFATGLTYL